MVSFDANESNTNWKLGLASLLVLYSSARKPKSCAEEILISPVRKRCQISTLAPTRDADNIFL